MTKKEKNLLGVFVALILVMGLLLGMNFYLKERNQMLADRDRLKSAAELAKQSPVINELYKEEKEWIELYTPDPIEYTVAESDFREFLDGLPKEFGLENSDTRSPTRGEAGQFCKINISTKAKGNQADVMKWLKKLHNPYEFRVIRSIKIVRDQKDNLLICEAEVERYIVEEEEDEL